MKDKGTCETCRYWTQTGIEDSGLKLTKTENWFYGVGKCTHPDTLHDSPPSFNSCHLWKKKRRAR